MKKAITSKYGKSVTVVERADWSIKFYDVETGRHYTRRVWYPVHGSDIFVQHRGGFYSIATEFKGKYDPQAISRYEVVSAEELETMAAEIIAHRAGKQYAAALTWEEATRVYAYAIVCNDADEYATMDDIVSGILQDRSKQPTQQATEATRAAADRAARALINAYAEAIGEYPEDDDPETIAAGNVAAAEIIGDREATAADLETVADMLEAIARSARRPDLTKYADMKYLELEPEPEPAPVYQRYELDAYLGDPDAYDVEAIEAEATAYDPKSGARVWSAIGEDLAAIAERHELFAYYAI